MIFQPDLLLHPNIPKPLHGVAPRIIKGDIWWDRRRRVAYSIKDYRCWACGVEKHKAKLHSWLEAHEVYDINYETGEVKLNKVCALCHYCHNFIHNGRLKALYDKRQIKLPFVKEVLEDGFKVLDKAKLPMNPFALAVAAEIAPAVFKKYKKKEVHDYGIVLARWEDWHLVLDGKKYYSKFKDITEWQRFYAT